MVHQDPNYQQVKNAEILSVKKKMYQEIINITLVMLLTFILFTFISKPLIKNKYAKEYIDNINSVFKEYALEKDYPITVGSNYDFLEIDEEKFIEEYIQKEDKTYEEAYEAYFDARVKTLEKTRNNEEFVLNNSKFNTIYFTIFSITVFIPLFIFEFLVIIFSKKFQNIGMLITNQSITNSYNNIKPSSYKLIVRLFVMFIFEHILIRIFFGNIYFLIILLLNWILVIASKDKVFLHDLLSMTRVIDVNYEGFTEG